MLIVDYDTILNQITRKGRLEADIDVVNYYINKYNWREVLVPRHQRIINLYIDNEYDISKTAKILNFSVTGLKSLFARIEAQFDLYEKNKDSVFVDVHEKVEEVIERHAKRIKIKEENRLHFENKENLEKEILKETKPKTSRLQKMIDQRNEKMEEVRAFLRNVNNLNKYLEKDYHALAMDVLEGLTLEEIAEKRRLSIQYLRGKIIGLPSGKRKRDKGLVKLIQEGISQ